MNQKTIKKEIAVEGIGLHSGAKAVLTIKPAAANHGYKFKRVDLEGEPVVAVDPDSVVSTTRGTTIQKGDASVSTVEHLLAALAALEIDNALLELDGPEVPIMDGSSIQFINAIESVGTEELDVEREYIVIEEPIRYVDSETGSELLILPADKFEIVSMIDFKSPVLGMQYAHLEDISEFKEKIAPCRTFVFLRELEYLLSQDLIKGGDLSNAIVIVDRKMNQDELDQLAAKLGKTSVKVEKEGVLNTIDLHFRNEPARHKLLDIVGDLNLLGKPIKGKVVASKPGHTVNVELAKLIKKAYKLQKKLKGKPKYDPAKEPIFYSVQIEETLPHRYPFQLVDKIIELNEKFVVGVKNVTKNEPFFQGHFPGNPVMPGVLQMEALAQTGGLLALSTQQDPENWDTYFLKMDKVKFKRKVVPGDTLVMKMELITPIRRGICHMFGTVYVGDNIVSEGELIAQIVKRS